jgi:alcohol dehydrogenase (cytochrome c)
LNFKHDNKGGSIVINNKAVIHGLRAAIIVVALGLISAAAQQIVYPASDNPTPGPMPALLQSYVPVNPERLVHPEDANWLLFRRTYDGWGYSPLAEITPANVSRLQPVWTFATGQVEGHQAPPMSS